MAAPGELDTDFDGNGKRVVGFGGVDAARAVLVQPDGRILLAGGGGPAPRFAVARLRRGGRPDDAFSGDGRRTLGFGGEQEGAFAAALQPDGRIVLAGDSDLRVAVARLRPDGGLDPTFSSDGKKTFGWGPISRAKAVLVLPSGKLLLAGFSGPEGGNVELARLHPDGPLDTEFGDDGRASIDFGGDDFGNALARQPDGRILVAGRSTAAGAIVARLRSNGTLDPSFGTGGRVTLPGGGSANAVLVQPDGRIVVAGNAIAERMRVTRLLPGGAPDPAFGGGDGDGVAEVDVAPLADQAAAAALQPDGRIVVAGSSQDSGDMAIARLLADGSPDPGFGGGDGIATVDFGAAAFAFAVALQPDGRILVAGQRTGDDEMAVARLHG
jgi:uncharacterized delta-60 repeat protein